MILQILARCGAFFIGFIVKGQMNHDFAFGIEVNPCVIEITIGKAINCVAPITYRDFAIERAKSFLYNTGTIKYIRKLKKKHTIATTK